MTEPEKKIIEFERLTPPEKKIIEEAWTKYPDSLDARYRHVEDYLTDTMWGNLMKEGAPEILHGFIGKLLESYDPPKFVIQEADAVEIRTIFERDGELSATIEVRRRFPEITNNAKAREHARSIAGCTPAPKAAEAPASVRFRAGKRR